MTRRLETIPRPCKNCGALVAEIPEDIGWWDDGGSVACLDSEAEIVLHNPIRCDRPVRREGRS